MFSSWFLSNWEALAFEVISSTWFVALFNLGVTSERRTAPLSPGCLRAYVWNFIRWPQAGLTSPADFDNPCLCSDPGESQHNFWAPGLLNYLSNLTDSLWKHLLRLLGQHHEGFCVVDIFLPMFSCPESESLSCVWGTPSMGISVKCRVHLLHFPSLCCREHDQGTASWPCILSDGTWWCHEDGQGRNHRRWSSQSSISLRGPAPGGHCRAVKQSVISGARWLERAEHRFCGGRVAQVLVGPVLPFTL